MRWSIYPINSDSFAESGWSMNCGDQSEKAQNVIYVFVYSQLLFFSLQDLHINITKPMVQALKPASVAERYRIINMVIAGYIFYILLLPFISPVMTKWFPRLWSCAYYRATGRSCPLCGFTRYLGGIFSSLGDYINPRSGFLFFFLLVNVFYRVGAIIWLESNQKSTRYVLFLDIIINMLLLVGFVIFLKFTQMN